MACVVEIAEPVRNFVPAQPLNLSDLRDLLDALENQGAEEELLEQIADSRLATLGW